MIPTQTAKSRYATGGIFHGPPGLGQALCLVELVHLTGERDRKETGHALAEVPLVDGALGVAIGFTSIRECCRDYRPGTIAKVCHGPILSVQHPRWGGISGSRGSPSGPEECPQLIAAFLLAHAAE